MTREQLGDIDALSFPMPDNMYTAERVHNDLLFYLENGLTHIEALLEYASKTGIEIETLGEIVKNSDVLKSKVRDDAYGINMLKKKNEDPVATLF